MVQRYIQATLAFYKQDRDKAADVLEISPATLQEKLKARDDNLPQAAASSKRAPSTA
jgi:DNA-binding NtrC family response regulator